MIRYALFFVLLAFPAFAQTASDTRVDLTPVVNYAIMFLVTAAGGLITWAAKKYFGIQLADSSKATIETAMQNGLALAVSKVAPNGLTVDTKSQVIATASNYVLSHAGDAAKYFGLDTNPALLAQKLEARLVQQPSASAVSPATAAPAS